MIGFRYPVVWAFPLLTKIAPGIGLLWFVVPARVAQPRHRHRGDGRDRRRLGRPRARPLARAGTSSCIGRVFERQAVEGAYLAIPVWLRLPFAVAVIAWGARTDRHWTVPIAVLLAMPILWLNVFALLLAVVPLREEPGLTPARAWLLRERLLPAIRPVPTSVAPPA